MGRRRIYQHYDVPGTVASMVQAMIQDYPRRQKLIDTDGCISEEWIRLNSVIAEVINSHEPMLSSIILSDIIQCRGYDSSKASILASKNLYYNLKHKLIEDIARKCNLI